MKKKLADLVRGLSNCCLDVRPDERQQLEHSDCIRQSLARRRQRTGRLAVAELLDE